MTRPERPGREGNQTSRAERGQRRKDLVRTRRGPNGYNYRSFVNVEQKTFFMALNKNACTSAKWALAELSGEDLSAFRPMLRPCVTFEDAIHNRRLWRRSPRLLELPDEIREDIDPENGWFVFAVTRDPRLRLFSAWQNKLLIDHPDYSSLRDASWYPRHPVTAESIVVDFGRFVEALDSSHGRELMSRDGHFMPQSRMLMLDTFEYNHLVDLVDLPVLERALTAHVRLAGWPTPVSFRGLNDSSLHAHEQLFADGVDERIRELYRVDYETFPGRWDEPQLRADGYRDDQLREVELRAGFGRRLEDALRQARRLERRLSEAELRLAELG